MGRRIGTVALSAVLATTVLGAASGCNSSTSGTSAADATTSTSVGISGAAGTSETSTPTTLRDAGNGAQTASGAQTLPATTPEDAVRRFVAAEAAGDFETSYALLASEDQADAQSADGWRSDHKSIPAFRGVTVTTANTTAPDRAEVSATVDFDARLDPVVGLIPAQADATWAAVSENGSWRVRYAETSFRGRYGNNDSAAASAVTSWATSRQNCALDAVGEYDGGLVGTVGLANQLCKASGQITVGSPGGLSGPEGTPVVAAFGPEAELWAKVVPVSGPVAMRAVVAPVGDTWMVIGVLSPAFNGGK